MVTDYVFRNNENAFFDTLLTILWCISGNVWHFEQEIDPKNVTAQESHKFCRVILPDSSTTVILASSGRTIQAALSELCQRRQLILELLLVSLAGDDKVSDFLIKQYMSYVFEYNR